MKEDFLKRAKQDGQVMLKLMNFAGKVSKLKLEIRSKNQERERLLRAVGAQVLEIYNRGGIEDVHAFDPLQHNIEALQELDQTIGALQTMIGEAREKLKGSPEKIVVDDDDDDLAE